MHSPSRGQLVTHEYDDASGHRLESARYRGNFRKFNPDTKVGRVDGGDFHA